MFASPLDSGGDALCLIAGEARLTRSELRDACAAQLAVLQRLGLKRGDRVAVWTHPGPECAVAMLANAIGGFVSVPLNPALGRRELAHILEDAQPQQVLDREDIVLRGPPAPFPSSPSGDEPLLLLYTSGTTGDPKGAQITAGNVAANLDDLIDAWALGPEDRVVHALPLFHVHGLVLGLFGSLRAGGGLHWCVPFAPDSLAAALTAGGSVLFAVPTIYHRLAEALEGSPAIAKALAAARLLVSGSAALPQREQRRLESACGRRVIERYGLTETLINCAQRADAPGEGGYVGRPLNQVALRLVDDTRAPFDDVDPEPERIGEIAVRGPNVFAGYLNRPEATAAVQDAEGWFYTGDLATRSASGELRILGRRATDLIKTGGFKVGAGEVEACLLEDPAVAEVAVAGVEDPDLGQRIEAWIVCRKGTTRPAPEALIDYVAGELSRHKRPRAIHFVDALPRNAMGKVQKARLGQDTQDH